MALRRYREGESVVIEKARTGWIVRAIESGQTAIRTFRNYGQVADFVSDYYTTDGSAEK